MDKPVKERTLTQELLQHACIPKRFWDAQAEKNSEVGRFIADIVSNLKRGNGIVLVGAHGIGKTWNAAAIARAALRHSVKVLFVTAQDLVDSFKPDAKRFDDDTTMLEALRSRRLLVIDDLGEEYRTANSGYAETTITNLIRYRVQHNLSTVLTTNLTAEDVETIYGPRLRSLLNEVGFAVEPPGGDRRRRPKKLPTE
jgi:DNA replication protein DnaC